MLKRIAFTLGAATLALGGVAVTAAVSAPAPQFPGHNPTGTYIGVHGDTTGMPTTAVTRSYFQWDDDLSEDKQIVRDHAAGKLPWVSFKPPACGLACISNGSMDAVIRAKAKRYRTYTKPVVTTFFHEPVGDVTAADWTAAYLRIDRIFANRGTGKVTFAPILNGYLWADWYAGSKGAVGDWLSPALVAASPLVGVDNYGTAAENARMINYFRAHGVRSAGVAEFGHEHGSADFQAQLDLYAANRGWLAVVAYFNSRVNVLTPGTTDFAAWNNYLGTTARLP